VLKVALNTIKPTKTNLDGEMQPLWSRVEDYTRELYAMREVFDMDSSVRIEAIEKYIFKHFFITSF
jgi:hypothetical protein